MNLGTSVLDWAICSPYATAVIDGEASLSREDLRIWCCDTADSLKEHLGPHPDGVPLVALMLPRSWAVPFSMVAVRLAGMAFLPLDTRLPRMRLASILEQAKPSLVLSFMTDQDWTSETLSMAGLSSAVVERKRMPPRLDLEWLSVHVLEDGLRLPLDIGHLVFTSGSTGAPKGVLLRDAPLLATVAAQRALLGTDGTGADAHAPSVWTLNPAFDASLSDMFCALLGSAPLAVFREEQSRWRSLAAFAKRHGAVRADLAPSLMRIVPPEAMGLKAVIFGGERCDAATAERWGRATRAFQAYGPTEAAVCAMIARAGEDWHEGLLGRPLDHQTVLLSTPDGIYQVLPRFPAADPDDATAFNAVTLEAYDEDAMLNGIPPVIEGEIWLAGDAVAAGYLDNPEATARRFGHLDGVPVHYSGDLVRFDGGQLHWIGRNDRQVKVNGRLICPEEIEASAERAWGGPCACIPDRHGLALVLGDPAREEDGIHPRDVLVRIADELGKGMQPRAALRIGAWPLNANGKTDLGEVARMACLTPQGAEA